ncbi:MAG: hypothetical protein ABIT20_04510 [Gemmatimonadaceae bacterium]
MTIKPLVVALTFGISAAVPAHYVNVVVDQYLAELFRNNPLSASMIGIADARQDLLNDNSLEALKREQQADDAMLASLE